jgi:hypothetical protein
MKGLFRNSMSVEMLHMGYYLNNMDFFTGVHGKNLSGKKSKK